MLLHIPTLFDLSTRCVVCLSQWHCYYTFFLRERRNSTRDRTLDNLFVSSQPKPIFYCCTSSPEATLLPCPTPSVESKMSKPPPRSSQRNMLSKHPSMLRPSVPANGSDYPSPLLEEGSTTETNVIQTASDCFHSCLLNMTSLVQELRAVEKLEHQDKFTLYHESPQRSLIVPGMLSSKWSELMHQLQVLQMSFIQMLFADQLESVKHFEIAVREVPTRNADGVIEQVEIEYVKASFKEPFLRSAFAFICGDIEVTGLATFSMIEIKKVTVEKIPVSWIREDRLPWNGLFAVTSQLHDRWDGCEVCQGPAKTPFKECWCCGDSPSFHHGRCCPQSQGAPFQPSRLSRSLVMSPMCWTLVSRCVA